MTFAIWKRSAAGAEKLFWQCGATTGETGRAVWRETWRQYRFMRSKGIATHITVIHRGRFSDVPV